MDIDKLTGQALSDAVAGMMGWRRGHQIKGTWFDEKGRFKSDCSYWHPHLDMNQVFEVVNKIRKGREWHLLIEPDGFIMSNFDAECVPLDGWTWDDTQINEEGKTPNEAILRAALKAIECGEK